MNSRSQSGEDETEAIVAADGTVKRASGTPTTLDATERRLLARMPLHAITSVHGEAGLRERLLLEIASFPAADRARAGDALALASRLHAQDRRQREPTVNGLAVCRRRMSTLVAPARFPPRAGPNRDRASTAELRRSP